MNTFILDIGKYVLPLAKEHNICPELVIAVALTSESCDKDGNPTELYTKCYNAFAARGKYNGNSVDVTFNETSNPVPCKVYASAEESVKDFFDILLTKKIKKKPDLKYANIIGITDYKEACKVFAEDGYCTWSGESYEQLLVAAIEAFIPDGLEALLVPPEVKKELVPIKEENLTKVTEAPKIEEVKKSNIDKDVKEEVEVVPRSRLRPAFTPHQGSEIKLDNTPVYSTATDTKPIMHLSGTFYLATGAVFKNRVHIVKYLSHIEAGRKFILGMVDLNDIIK